MVQHVVERVMEMDVDNLCSAATCKVSDSNRSLVSAGKKGNVCPSLIPWASPSGHAARPGISSSRAAGADTRSLGLARYHRVIAR
jgi:hypothetical protein